MLCETFVVGVSYRDVRVNSGRTGTLSADAEDAVCRLLRATTDHRSRGSDVEQVFVELH